MTRKLVCLSIIAICLVMLLHPDGVVSAHLFLKSSQPASDQIVAQAPIQVVLVFSGSVRVTGNQTTVTDAAGQHFETGNITLDPATHTTMTIDLKPLPDGVYTVSYTVISAADGHETVDNFRFGVGNVFLPPDAPGRACAMLPTITAQGNSKNASVRIVSPIDNSRFISSHVDYAIETKNFNLGSNGNYADVWIDGQRVEKINSSGGHSLDLTNGIHDMCIALMDGASGTEVGARAGIRLLVSVYVGPESSNGSILTVVVLTSIAIIALCVVVLILVYIYRRRRTA